MSCLKFGLSEWVDGKWDSWEPNGKPFFLNIVIFYIFCLPLENNRNSFKESLLV